MGSINVNVAAYNHSNALARSEVYSQWAAANGGPVRTVHVVNVPFDNGPYATHRALKMSVNELGDPYFYQPQAQLEDRELIIKENRGCVLINRSDEEVTFMCLNTLKRHVRLPHHTPPACVRAPDLSRRDGAAARKHRRGREDGVRHAQLQQGQHHHERHHATRPGAPHPAPHPRARRRVVRPHGRRHQQHQRRGREDEQKRDAVQAPFAQTSPSQRHVLPECRCRDGSLIAAGRNVWLEAANRPRRACLAARCCGQPCEHHVNVS